MELINTLLRLKGERGEYVNIRGIAKVHVNVHEGHNRLVCFSAANRERIEERNSHRREGEKKIMRPMPIDRKCEYCGASNCKLLILVCNMWICIWCKASWHKKPSMS